MNFKLFMTFLKDKTKAEKIMLDDTEINFVKEQKEEKIIELPTDEYQIYEVFKEKEDKIIVQFHLDETKNFLDEKPAYFEIVFENEEKFEEFMENCKKQYEHNKNYKL